MMTGPSPSTTPIRINPPFRKQGRRATVSLHSRNGANAASPLTVRRLRKPSANRGREPERRLAARRFDNANKNAVPLSP